MTWRSDLPTLLVRLAVIGLCLVLLLAPLPLGANRLWSAALMAVAMGALAALYGVAVWRQPQLCALKCQTGLVLTGIVAVMVMAFALWQTTGWHAAEWAHPLWLEAQKILSQTDQTFSLTPRIALDPTATYTSVLRFGMYAVVFFMALSVAAHADDAHLLLRMIIFAGVLYALYGLSMEFMGLNMILWMEKTRYIDNLTSTFINRNSYATYAGMGFLAAVAFVLRRWRHAWDEIDKKNFWHDLLQRFVGRELVWVLLPLVLLVALIYSDSRAGFFSTMAGLVVLVLAFSLNRKLSVVTAGLLALGMVGLALFGLALGGAGLLERLSGSALASDVPYRWRVYELTWQAILNNPWFGHGFGNFDQAFRLYRDPSVEGWVHKTHNDYLELAFDLGLPMAILVLAALAYLVWRCLMGAMERQRDAIFPILALAVSVQVGLHSVVDFSLQIPAISVTYATILGMGVAQSWSSRMRGSTS
ncbi:MAG: O-antigen ligase domain-containing protein [Alphaproteobacteria bacterium]|nr:O-antigen ligase domain-containing protein [Alphaproteobacteria bacterium]